jgi:hypothetical protein
MSYSTSEESLSSSQNHSEGRLPTFLVIGAAKAGTTSVYYYLSEHPEIFMSPLKEVRFFGDGDKTVNNIDEYKALFKTSGNYKMFGEASPQYLIRSSSAPSQIKKLIPNAKLVVLLRDPADRAYAHYVYANFSLGLKNQFSYSKSWQIGDYSRLIRELPQPLTRSTLKKTEWTAHHFGLVSSFYADDLQNYLKVFSRENFKILLYDDLKADPIKTMADIYTFLDVDSSFVPNIETRHNVTYIPNTDYLDSLLKDSSIVKNLIKGFIPKSFKERLVNFTRQVNYSKRYQPLNSEDRKILIDIFREDILQTQELLGRDLSHWLKV